MLIDQATLVAGPTTAADTSAPAAFYPPVGTDDVIVDRHDEGAHAAIVASPVVPNAVHPTPGKGGDDIDPEDGAGKLDGQCMYYALKKAGCKMPMGVLNETLLLPAYADSKYGEKNNWWHPQVIYKALLRYQEQSSRGFIFMKLKPATIKLLMAMNIRELLTHIPTGGCRLLEKSGQCSILRVYFV